MGAAVDIGKTPANVFSLLASPRYQERMLERVTHHDGFRSRRTSKGLRDVLYLHGTVSMDWLREQYVCVYFRTRHYFYASPVETVEVEGDRIALVCLGFVREVPTEHTPDIGVGVSLVTYLNITRSIPGEPVVGHQASPTLPL